MLKLTGVKLEEISDTDKHLFVEKGLTGGVCYIAEIYAKVNNKYMNDHDSKKPSKFITYLDMNNFYDWGLSEYLPYGGFKSLKNVDTFDVSSISEKNPIGYFLGVDIEYPVNYMNCTMIIPQPQKNLQRLMKCCQIIVKKLQINMR